MSTSFGRGVLISAGWWRPIWAGPPSLRAIHRSHDQGPFPPATPVLIRRRIPAKISRGPAFSMFLCYGSRYLMINRGRRLDNALPLWKRM